MPRRFPNILILVILNLVVASPALIGRDGQGGDSLWGLDLEDVIGAGAAGLDALCRRRARNWVCGPQKTIQIDYDYD